MVWVFAFLAFLARKLIVEESKCPMKVILHRDFPFLKQWKMLHAVKEGGPDLRGQVRRLMDDLSQGISPPRSSRFSDLQGSDAVPYDLGNGHALITIQSGPVIVIYAVGTSQWVRQWLESHTEVRMLASVEGKNLQLLVRGDVQAGDFEVRQADESVDRQIPLLPRLEGVDWRKVIGHRGIARRLLEFTRDQDIADLRKALDDLRARDAKLADLLTTALFYLMEDRVAEARAAVQEHFGPDRKVTPPTPPAALTETSLREGIDPEQVLVLNGLSPEELDRVFDPIRFLDWMQFLEREQKKMVDEDYDHPIVLRGVSGSGKTVVVVHRACRLARANPHSRILTITLNQDLSVLIESLVGTFASKDELPSLQVRSLSGYLRELVREARFEKVVERWRTYLESVEAGPGEEILFGPAYRDEVLAPKREWEYRALFRLFVDHPGNGCQQEVQRLRKVLGHRADSAIYLHDEVNYVRSLSSCAGAYEEYLNVERKGRSIGFDLPTRQMVLALTRAWERYQWRNGFVDPATLTQMVSLLLKEGLQVPEHLRFDHVLVDEFQDLSTQEVNLIASIARSGRNSLFLTGDDAQRVSVKHLRLPDTPAGGRECRRFIRKNFRNTVEILEAANSMMPEANQALVKSFGETGEGFEILNPEFSQRRGPKPSMIRSRSPLEAAWKVALERLVQGVPPCSICLISMNTQEIPLESILEACPSILDASLLRGDYLSRPYQFVVSDALGIKGFEFSNVLIVGVEDGMFPLPGLPQGEQWRDALRLYSAMTRGRNEVHFFCRQKPSGPFQVMKRFLDHRSM